MDLQHNGSAVENSGSLSARQSGSVASELETLFRDVVTLRTRVARDAAKLLAGFGPGEHQREIINLAHYISLRRHDIRSLQRRLMCHGLSSMGRLESRVMPTFDAVLAALSAMTGQAQDACFETDADFFSGQEHLDRVTADLFGPKPLTRRSRIMVTLPSEAAEDGRLLRRLVRKGMNVARINCAHDNPFVWRRMAEQINAAAKKEERDVRILMDIAGPKIRVESVFSANKVPKLVAGDRFRLVLSSKLGAHPSITVSASVSLPQMVERLIVGDRVLYDDSKLEGTVESVSDGEAIVEVKRSKAGGAKIKPNKGVNLPDTSLGISPLTNKDKGDLKTVVALADMIGYSFVSGPDDIDLLEDTLQAMKLSDRPLGIVAKIERPEAVENLPALIARASGRRPLAVMIARGDLASEIGFERLAEMQEEILWICEAASTPVIWATQVLESLVKFGNPSRGDMTDAAMAARAECVMLNKGPAVDEAVELLDRLATRMEGHLTKKTPTLRALRSW